MGSRMRSLRLSGCGDIIHPVQAQAQEPQPSVADDSVEIAMQIFADRADIARKPSLGEKFTLERAVKPKTIAMEMCQAFGWAHYPVLLWYRGERSKALMLNMLQL